MPLVSALDGQQLSVMQPISGNVDASPRTTAAQAERIVALLVRCHSQRRQLKASADPVLATPRSRALSAESAALTPAELEWLRSAKEQTSTHEWAKLKKRAKAASVAEAQLSAENVLPQVHSPLGLGAKSGTPRSGVAPQSSRRQAKALQAELSGAPLLRARCASFRP